MNWKTFLDFKNTAGLSSEHLNKNMISNIEKIGKKIDTSKIDVLLLWLTIQIIS